MSDLFTAATHDAGGRSKPAWPADSTVTAAFSTCGCYRYNLIETWSFDPVVMWLMMNPSVAGIEHSDPTLIRTGRFSRAWGYGGQLIGNMHAYRATDSKRLLTVADPIGAENDEHILRMARRAAMVVLAYGQPPKPLRPRAQKVITMLRDAGVRLTYLRLAKDGTPWHPLYLPGDTMPQDYHA